MSRIGRDRLYRQVRARVLAGAQVCWICGGALDWDAPPRSSKAPSADHVLPISRTAGLDPQTRQRLATDPGNLRPTHYGCNSKRGNRRRHPVHVSRSWL
jgi:5-methylcytosine-specific restriction endonuclease McrA